MTTRQWVISNCRFAMESGMAPADLYHVTPYADKILAEGFKPGMPQTFGGSTQGGASFTTLEGAQNYAKGLAVMLRFQRGELGLQDMYQIGAEFGLGPEAVKQSIDYCLKDRHMSFFDEQYFAMFPNKLKPFLYDVLLSISRLSKNRFPFVFRDGLENMISAGKTENDIHILKVTFPEPQQAQLNKSESEWRIPHDKLQGGKIELVQ